MAEYIYDFKEPPDPEGYRGRLTRCKDCKHSSASILRNIGWKVCNFHGRPVVEDDFCSEGDRREND